MQVSGIVSVLYQLLVGICYDQGSLDAAWDIAKAGMKMTEKI